MVKIRKARLKELDEIVEIWKRFMEQQRELGREWGEDRIPRMKEDSSDIVRSYFSRNIRSKHGLLIVLEDQERIQGYMLCTIQKNIPVFDNDYVGYVSDIYLEEPYRGRDHSSRMFAIAQDWFGMKGINEVSIRVMCCNAHAHNVYEHWGFKDIHVMMRMNL